MLKETERQQIKLKIISNIERIEEYVHLHRRDYAARNQTWVSLVYEDHRPTGESSLRSAELRR